MNTDERNQAQPAADQSPADKLADHPPTDADTPGAQNPEHEEIKHEQGLNTE